MNKLDCRFVIAVIMAYKSTDTNKSRFNKNKIQYLKKEQEEMIPLYMMELLMLKWTLKEMKEGREVSILNHVEKEREIKTQTGYYGSLGWVKSVLND